MGQPGVPYIKCQQITWSKHPKWRVRKLNIWSCNKHVFTYTPRPSKYLGKWNNIFTMLFLWPIFMGTSVGSKYINKYQVVQNITFSWLLIWLLYTSMFFCFHYNPKLYWFFDTDSFDCDIPHDVSYNPRTNHQPGPIGSMYGIYANIGDILMVNVTIYSIHGSYGGYSLRDVFFFRKRRLENTPRHLQVAHLSEDFQVALRCQRLMLIATPSPKTIQKKKNHYSRIGFY